MPIDIDQDSENDKQVSLINTCDAKEDSTLHSINVQSLDLNNCMVIMQTLCQAGYKSEQTRNLAGSILGLLARYT